MIFRRKQRSDSADIAKQRLIYICADDRQRQDGRTRIVKMLTSMSSSRVVFDKPITIMMNETLHVNATYRIDNGYIDHEIIVGKQVPE